VSHSGDYVHLLLAGSAESGPRVCYDAFDAHVVVVASDEELGEIVRRLFPAYEIGADASPHLPTAAMVLSRLGTTFELETSIHAAPFSFDTLDEVVGGVEFALMETFLSLGSRFVQLHASGIVDGDQAIIALGGSGRGKSSLALTWCLGGKPVLGDDVVLIDEDGLCHPFKRQFKVDPVILRKSGFDPRDTPFWKYGAEEAWFDPGAEGWAVPTPASLVALLQFEPDCDLVVREVARPDGLNALLHSRFKTGCPEQTSFHRLAQLVERVRVLDVRFSSAADAARALADYVP
jgi:hypothetical protein